MSDNGLVWEEPPQSWDRSPKWGEIVRALQARPGEWAVIYEQQPNDSEIQARNKQYNVKAWGARHFIKVETATRIVDGQVKIYGRVPVVTEAS